MKYYCATFRDKEQNIIWGCTILAGTSADAYRKARVVEPKGTDSVTVILDTQRNCESKVKPYDFVPVVDPDPEDPFKD